MRRIKPNPATRSELALTARRWETTGDWHSYRPGRITLFCRGVFNAVAGVSLKKKIALRMQAGLERVEAMEKEQQWLKCHGSPLEVMGLPEHAELAEVRARYRDLLLETHPDTSLSKALIPDRDAYHLLMTAYEMATNPDSLWHKNHSAPDLYRELVAQRPFYRRHNVEIAAFAGIAYIMMIVGGILGGALGMYYFTLFSLRWMDPEFYEFMLKQEAEEQRKRDAGEEVDTNPRRLMPVQLQRLWSPGKFVVRGSEAEEPEAEDKGG
jgi:hypothetical protein